MSRDDGTLTLRVLAVVAWAGWAFLTVTITLEVASRLRRMPTPHLPALALPQSAAQGLVGAAVLLFVAGPSIAAAPTAAASTSASATPGQNRTAAAFPPVSHRDAATRPEPAAAVAHRHPW